MLQIVTTCLSVLLAVAVTGPWSLHVGFAGVALLNLIAADPAR